MLMDTRQLAAFCAVVEKSSFSQAAEKLGVTQPAVSLQVRALEERLGQTLLDRSGRRVEPTEAGLRLYRSAQRMLALEEQLYDEVAAESGELQGTLAIGASTEKSTQPPFTRVDVFAVNALAGQIFGQGGGDEARRSEFLDALRKRLGARARAPGVRRPHRVQRPRLADHDHQARSPTGKLPGRQGQRRPRRRLVQADRAAGSPAPPARRAGRATS